MVKSVEVMRDIALATGGTFFTKESGRDFSDFKLKSLVSKC